jgi:bisphosphoglycerate-independent phosphoglycerate mutase (AlkP superfamily)
VPCILVAKKDEHSNKLLIDGRLVGGIADGILSDVAPTILDMLELEKPQEMDRNSLIVYV